MNIGLFQYFSRKGYFMGNSMISQVGSTTAATAPTSYSGGLNTGFNTTMPNGLFNMGMVKDYSNDMMMPDWLKAGNITDEQRASIFGPMYLPAQNQAIGQTQQTQAQTQYPQIQNPYAPAFNGQQAAKPQYTQEQLTQYYEQLLAENPNLKITEKGNVYESTNTAKKIGVLTGIGTALAGGITKLFKGTTLKSAFSLKDLAVKIPALTIAGWAIGSAIDAFINSNSAKQADAQTQKV